MKELLHDDDVREEGREEGRLEGREDSIEERSTDDDCPDRA